VNVGVYVGVGVTETRGVLSMFKGCTGRVKVGLGPIISGGVGVASTPGIPGRGVRSTVTFNVPQAERAMIVIKNNKGIFLNISSSKQKCYEEFLIAYLYQGAVTGL